MSTQTSALRTIHILRYEKRPAPERDGHFMSAAGSRGGVMRLPGQELSPVLSGLGTAQVH
jgi:hypothetical protein